MMNLPHGMAQLAPSVGRVDPRLPTLAAIH